MAGNAPARKERPTGLIGQIKWLAIAFIALLVFVFLAFFASRFQGTKLEAKLGDKSISIRTTGYQVPVEEIEALDTRESFVSSEQGFAFKLPTTEGWSKPASLDLLKELEAKDLTPEELIQLVGGDPSDKRAVNAVQSVFREISVTRLTSGEGIEIEGGLFKNEFTVTVFPKTTTDEFFRTRSLPTFALRTSSLFVQAEIDKLVADEHSVLLGFSITQPESENGLARETRLDRWVLFTDNDDSFFVVEIAFSPQTAQSPEVWEQLRTMQDSFEIIES